MTDYATRCYEPWRKIKQGVRVRRPGQGLPILNKVVRVKGSLSFATFGQRPKGGVGDSQAET